jgi:hypothetical protein
MSPTRSGYRELGLELVSLEDNRSCQHKRPPMAEEKRNKGAEDLINMLLVEALAQQRNRMLVNFTQILQQLSTIIGMSLSNSHFGDATPFKVQVNFDIPIFEGQIDADALEKWLNLLKGYFYVDIFSDRENITFVLLKALPHVKHSWKTYWEKNPQRSLEYLGLSPLGIFLWM